MLGFFNERANLSSGAVRPCLATSGSAINGPLRDSSVVSRLLIFIVSFAQKPAG